ncbi:50S ribosomal protein L11 methyltransferase [Peptoniphilus stercorisuis]|uniref:Ribosomal protein L11 methyltransferase n=1 Tax=Peptoniphilus stercorisuis TaxID=1436965 RepID=A0ABS4KDQ8_9FIRM|nr:50S ribosomal protein L11 methyltransferase [Peptoniphilus stercorisuis]MBP2024784.1 ribosomal protein L11 methyltransferase [Peptoniphilus stercorisuis]
MRYIELKVVTNDLKVEDVKEILYKNDIYTFEEEGMELIDELNQQKDDWDFVDESVFDIEEGVVIIKCYFSENEEDFASKVAKELSNISKTTITFTDDKDWANNWKKYYHPLEIGKHIAIKPTWEEYENKDRVVIDIDPGMAFGTGTHETTYLCLEALENYVKKDDIIFDIGCGSGILGIAAIKLGAKEVLAVDIDEKCIEATTENAKINNTTDSMKIYKGNLLDVIDSSADIIVSNIIAEIIAEMIPELKLHLKGEKLFIASGIIVEKIHIVKDALEKEGFEILEINKKNGWAQITGRVI